MKNKEQTKRKLIQALGELIKEYGFQSLSASKVARKAEVDRKLITRYFGGLNHLVEAYILENDYWMLFADHIGELLKSNSYPSTKELITAVLQNQFRFFFNQKDMQRLILWELTFSSPMMTSIHHAREAMGQKLFEWTDPHFENSAINFRAISAFIVGGTYYMILHSIYNGGTFTDMDLNSEKGQEDILKAIGQVVDWAFAAAEKVKPA